MKTFFSFLTEVDDLRGAKAQASKLNLKSDGHGGWLNSRGEQVAKTEGGKLVFLKKKDPRAEDPAKKMPQGRAGAQPTDPKQKKPEAAAPKKAETGDGSDEGTASSDLTVAFGRFNPPTIGHEKLLQAAQKASQGGDLKIYPSRTQDGKKNPLDPDMKISFMKKMFPDFEEQIINDSEMVSIFNVLTTASEEGYKNVNIIVGADRQSEFENLAQKYNGDLYNFDQIRVISAGVRDADAEGVEGMSASKMRKAVADGDFEAFKKGTPSKLKGADVQAVYDAVRQGMGAKKVKKESYDLWEIAPKSDQRSLRENYMLGKIFNLGALVENLNTGLIGKVIRKGTNYLICVTEQDNMFKSWIHDVMETKDKKVIPSDKSGIYGVAAKDREVGTDAHRRYAQSMVPGQEEIKNFNIKEFINKYKIKK